MTYRPDIQLLRGISVLLVVFYHLGIPYFNNGFLGVDVFFVISGFLMAQLFDQGTKIDFYRRRAKRLLPAYYWTILGTVSLGAFLTLKVDFDFMFQQALYALVFAGNLGTWSTNTYFSKAYFNPLLNLWSLAVEIQFYLLVPLCFPFLRRFKFVNIVLIVANLAACLIIASISPKTSFFMMPLRIWEFMIGAFAAWYFTARAEEKNTVFQAFLIFIFLACLLIPFEPEKLQFGLGHPGLIAVIVCFITAAILVVRLPKNLTESYFGRLFVFIGNRSYSIYLVHFPIIILYNYKPFGGNQITAESWQAFVVLMLMIALASEMSYQFIEKNNKNNLKFVRRTIPIAIALTTVFLAAFMYQETRYSDKEANVFGAWTDRDTYRCGKWFRITNPTKLVCELTGLQDPEAEKVLLLGNSHADSIKKTFSDLAKTRNMKVYFHTGNERIMDVDSFYDVVMADVNLLNIGSVVIHYNQRMYSERFLTELRKTITSLNTQGTPVAIVSPVPIYESHVPKSLYAALQAANDFQPLTKEDHRAQNERFWHWVDDASEDNFVVYDSSTYLCPKKCLVRDEAWKPLYFDGDHLTVEGSRYLLPVFKTILAQMSGG